MTLTFSPPECYREPILAHGLKVSMNIILDLREVSPIIKIHAK